MSKLSTVIAATLLIAAGAASAQTATTLTREQVVAELVAARNSGELAALQAEKGVEATPAAAKGVTARLPRQAVLVARPTEVRTVAEVVADQGLNAAREMGDFPAPIARRATTLAGR